MSPSETFLCKLLDNDGCDPNIALPSKTENVLRSVSISGFGFHRLEPDIVRNSGTFIRDVGIGRLSISIWCMNGWWAGGLNSTGVSGSVLNMNLLISAGLLG